MHLFPRFLAVLKLDFLIRGWKIIIVLYFDIFTQFLLVYVNNFCICVHGYIVTPIGSYLPYHYKYRMIHIHSARYGVRGHVGGLTQTLTESPKSRAIRLF